MKLLRVAVLALFLLNIINAEQVGQVVFQGSIDDFQLLSQLTVPYNIVALGDELYMNSPDTTQGGTASTIQFLVDNSITMEESDRDANRFTVVRDLIDTITTNQTKFPDLELGLSVYAQKLELKDSLPEVQLLIGGSYSNSGSYLRPLDLDSSYSGKTAPNLIKDYLQTIRAVPRYSHATNDTVTVLDPILLNQLNSSTVANNNIGFESIENAMNYSSALPENQYVILLTDGDGGIDGTKGDWRWREDIPTTFTIFFSPDGSTPLSLQEFTTSMQSSPYSASNPQTSLFAYNNTSREALFNFIMDNIISKIVGDIITAPSSVTINGTVHDFIWNDSDAIAELDGPTPLTGSSTPLSMLIQYVTTYDSTVSFDSTVTVFDTTYDTVAVPIVIDPNLTTPASNLKATYWDRTLAVRSGGVAVPSVTRTMDSVEISFAYDPLTAGYNYTTVSVLLTNRNSSVNESETITLTKVAGENRFSAMVPRSTVSGAAVQGDGIIQHSPVDTFDIFFQNSEPITLPLDTLSLSIPVYTYDDHVVSLSALFDTNADGFPDAFKMTVTGGEASALATALESKITLPSRYTLTPSASTVSGNVITYPVSYNEAGFKTIVDGSDVITVSDTIRFGNFSIFYPGTFALTDSMAPVITSALYETVLGQDQLSVGFSESVAAIAHDTVFTLVSGSGNPDYTASLSLVSQSGASATFDVNNLVGAVSVETGDSIKIRTTGAATVTDLLGVAQFNLQNRREPLALTREQKINAVSIWDKNADGYPDALELSVEGVKLDSLAQSLDTLITWPAFFTLNKASASVSGNTITMPITYDPAQGIRTHMSGESITIADTITYGDNSILLPTGTLPIVDKMAPVALTARYVTVPSKELTVTFSEELSAISHSVPFTFIVYSGGTSYTGTFTNSALDAKTVRFALTSLSGAAGINEGDSLYIRESEAQSISDTLSNDQRNSANKRVPITVVRQLLSSALFDGNADGYPDTLTITTSGGDAAALLDDISSVVTVPSFLTLQAGGRTNGAELVIPVTYDVAQGYKTALNGETVTVADTVLYTNGVMLPSNLVIADSMAPILTSALIVDDTALVPAGAKELITFTFSESIDSITEKIPLTFISKDMNGREYTATLSGVSHNADTMRFTVDSLTGSVFIGRGDSAYIKTDGITSGVSDTFNLLQLNSANRRVLVEAVRTHYLQGASMFDQDADGYPDEVKIRATGVRVDVLASFAVSVFPFPSYLTAEPGATVLGDVISVRVLYDTTLGYRTYTENDSLIIAAKTEFDTSRFLMPERLEILDSMAPIVTSAVLVDDTALLTAGVTEQLSVTFSEDVSAITESVPFTLIATNSGTQYNASLSLLSQSADSASFSVDSLTGASFIENGDSLFIRTGIEDSNGIVQANTLNRRALVATYRTHYLEEAALFDQNADGYPDLLKVKTSGARQDLLALNSGLFTIPSYITVGTGVTSTDGIVSIPVVYDSVNGLRTHTAGETIIVPLDSVFITNTTIKAGSVVVQDSMAPVVKAVSLVDDSAVIPAGVSELLTVTFSEEVGTISDAQPFTFINSAASTEYSAGLTLVSSFGDSVLFAVDSVMVEQYINDGDSLYIATAGVAKGVVDSFGVQQGNILNRRVPIAAVQTIYLHSAAMFDRNADGYPDELVIDASGQRLDFLTNGIGTTLPLPAFVTADTGAVVTNNRTAIPLIYDTTLAFKTSLNSDSLVISSATAIHTTGLIMPVALEIIDSMAPVVTFAEMVDSLYPGHVDLLRVGFSEPVDSIIMTQPFTFVTAGGTFTATMTPSEYSSDTVSFVITGYSDTATITADDSLFILVSDTLAVADLSGIEQKNGLNRREEIILTSISEYVSVSSAAFFDGDGNGTVDIVKVKVSGRYAGTYIDSIVAILDFPENRTMTVDSVVWDSLNSTMVIMVESDLEKTDISPLDTVALIAEAPVATGLQLAPFAVLPLDSMAPVIMQAYLVDSVTVTKDDILTVEFSEPVAFSFAATPFTVISPEGVLKQNVMTPVSIDSVTVLFTIPADSSAPNSTRPNGEDSIRINLASPGVSDSLGNVQVVLENILREIQVQYEIDPYKLELLATLTLSDRSLGLEQLAAINEELYDQSQTVTDDYIILSIVSNPREAFFDFDEIEAKVSIYDVVGNLVIENITMSYDENTKALYAIWNTSSDKGRQVGRGAYVALGDLRFRRMGKEEKEFVLKALIGVQR